MSQNKVKTGCQTCCSCCSSEIEAKYLTIKIKEVKKENYFDIFMTLLKERVCCYGVTFPFVLVQYGEGIRVENNGKVGLPLTLNDIEGELRKWKEICARKASALA